jgi:uncharacterized protein
MIDTHIHVVPPQLPGAGLLAPLLRQPLETIANAVIVEMQSSGITTAFAMGEWRITPDDPLGVNRTLAVAAMVPGLCAIGVMDPQKSPDDREHFDRVEHVLQAGRVVALKGYLGYLHYDPSHATYRRYYELAERHRIPVIFHTGDTYSMYAKLKFAHPLGVDDVAVDHPEVRFVIAHVGNPWMIDAAEVVYKNVNVWADLSGLVVGEDVFANADALADVRSRVQQAIRYSDRPNRFLYGSDWPLAAMKPYREFIASCVPSIMHEQIFRDNAALLFRR